MATRHDLWVQPGIEPGPPALEALDSQGIPGKKLSNQSLLNSEETVILLMSLQFKKKKIIIRKISTAINCQKDVVL